MAAKPSGSFATLAVFSPTIFCKPIIDWLFDNHTRYYLGFVLLYFLLIAAVRALTALKRSNGRRLVTDQLRHNWPYALNRHFWRSISRVKRAVINDRVGYFSLIASLIIAILHIPIEGLPGLKGASTTVHIYIFSVLLVIIMLAVHLGEWIKYSLPKEDAESDIKENAVAAVIPKVIPPSGSAANKLILDLLSVSKGRIRIMALHGGFILGTPGHIGRILKNPDVRIDAIILDPLNKHVRRRARRIVGEFSDEYIGSFYDNAKNILSLKSDRVRVKVLNRQPSYRLFLTEDLALIQYYEPYIHGNESPMLVATRKKPYEIPSKVVQALGGASINIPTKSSTLYDYYTECFLGQWREAKGIQTLENESEDYLKRLHRALFKFRCTPDGRVSIIQQIEERLRRSCSRRCVGVWPTSRNTVMTAIKDCCRRVGAQLIGDDSNFEIKAENGSFAFHGNLAEDEGRSTAEFSATTAPSWRAAKRLFSDINEAITC